MDDRPTIGVLGGGQLARMLAQAAIPLGVGVRTWDTTPQAPAGPATELIAAPFDDQDALVRFSEGLSAATCEFENIPSSLLRAVEQRAVMHPGAHAVAIAQERLAEKQFLTDHEVPTAPFAPVDAHDQLASSADHVGFPLVMKTRRMGYDGRGQAIVRRSDDLEGAWRGLGAQAVLLEGFIEFDRELSLISVRSAHADFVHYPLVENLHHDGILRRTIAPAGGVDQSMQAVAQANAERLMNALDYVGVMTVEYFQTHDGLIANEIAPRVHNSGHWTIEGAETSQFENHVRAVLGWPLGSTAPRGHSAMINLIARMPPHEPLLRLTGVHLHDYSKSARPGRKLGHVTLTAESANELQARLAEAEGLIFN